MITIVDELIDYLKSKWQTWDSEPSGANIYVDGMKQGQTPVDSLIVRTGLHTLLVRLDDYQDWTGTVQVGQGEMKFIPTIKLHKK